MAPLKRAAVVLFNLGGPDRPDSVEPFLFNLFDDPAIVTAPWPVRWLIAKIISRRRAPVAREIYAKLGGASPILAETRKQAAALERALQIEQPGVAWRVTVAMRHWHPFARETAAELRSFDPQELVLLPLYPQYSGTTSGSSLADWRHAAGKAALDVPSTAVCCYPDHPRLIAAQVALIAEALTGVREEIGRDRALRLLLSAHGLPERVIARGDPYQWQVERTAAAIEAHLREDGHMQGRIEVVTCYQSRVGPLAWIGPATDAEIARAGADGAGVVVTPIAFVSEHAETLVELDMEYAALARAAGVPCYRRVPALGTGTEFIAALAELVVAATERSNGADENPVTGISQPAACAGGFPACPRRAKGP